MSNEVHLITDKIFTVRNGWGKADASFVSPWLFLVILILIFAFIVLALFFDCQADFDVDNVQRRELVIFYGV